MTCASDKSDVRDLLREARRWMRAPSFADYQTYTDKWVLDVADYSALVTRIDTELAQAIEAGTAETGTGSVHESAVAESDAP